MEIATAPKKRREEQRCAVSERERERGRKRRNEGRNYEIAKWTRVLPYFIGLKKVTRPLTGYASRWVAFRAILFRSFESVFRYIYLVLMVCFVHHTNKQKLERHKSATRDFLTGIFMIMSHKIFPFAFFHSALSRSYNTNTHTHIFAEWNG